MGNSCWTRRLQNLMPSSNAIEVCPLFQQKLRTNIYFARAHPHEPLSIPLRKARANETFLKRKSFTAFFLLFIATKRLCPLETWEEGWEERKRICEKENYSYLLEFDIPIFMRAKKFISVKMYHMSWIICYPSFCFPSYILNIMRKCFLIWNSEI